MALAAFVALLLIPSTEPPPKGEVAYIARYYLSGSRKSSFHVYLSTLDGTRRRRLTQVPVEGHEIVWTSRNHLAWESKTGVWDSYALKTGRTQRLRERPKTRRGHLAYDVLQDDFAKARLPDGSWMSWATEPGEDMVVARNGVSLELDRPQHLGSSIWRHWTDGRKPQTWTVAGDSSANGVEAEEVLYRVDWKANRTQKWQTELFDVELVPSRGLYLAHRSRNWEWNLADLGDGRFVFVNRIYVGSLATKQIWRVVDGLVLPRGFALRPLR